MNSSDERTEDGESGGREVRSKVSRLIEKYGIHELRDELPKRWLGDGRPRESLRDLAELFNQHLLKAAIELTDGQIIDGEVENLYRLLSDDSVTESARAQAETKLDRMGVDPTSVRREFVSHQAIHTYLTKYRGIEAPVDHDSPSDSTKKRSEAINRLRSRLTAVSQRSLENLRKSGQINLDSFEVIVGVRVYCNDCGSTYDVTELLEQGGCECRLESS